MYRSLESDSLVPRVLALIRERYVRFHLLNVEFSAFIWVLLCLCFNRRWRGGIVRWLTRRSHRLVLNKDLILLDVYLLFAVLIVADASSLALSRNAWRVGLGSWGRRRRTQRIRLILTVSYYRSVVACLQQDDFRACRFAQEVAVLICVCC